MSSFSFNALLLEISNGLSTDQLEQMKFLCREDIGKRNLETCNTGVKLFQFLTQRKKLGADNTDYLCSLLTHIKRDDLCQKLDNSYNGGEQVNTSERDDLDYATEVLAEHLGRQWRKLGRKLGLSEVKLDSISKKHPSDLEETTVELVKEWRKTRAQGATVEALITALRKCDLNLTADNVLDKLREISDQNSV